MAIDVTTPQSPGWWLDRLSKKLVDARKDYVDLYARYEGESPVPPSLQAAPEAAQRFFKVCRTNFAEMVIKAVLYPIKMQSVATSVERSAVGDAVAWEVMKATGMLEEESAVKRNMLIAGRSYAMCFVHPEYGPRYTAEDPREVITIQDPVVQSVVRAGMKITHDDINDRILCWLYLPGKVYRCSMPGKSTNALPRFSPHAFEWDEDAGGADGLDLPAPFQNTVPVVPYRNEEGIGEFKRHRDVLDRIDHMILQGMTIATYQAFKQRAIKADDDDMPQFDEQGNEIDYNDVFSADPGALWQLPKTAEMWESGAVDLTPVWTGIDKGIQQFSAVTFTPLAMFSPEGQNQSAEGATFAREGRTFKIEDRQDLIATSHARALSMLLTMSGHAERALEAGIRVTWKPAERYSLTSRASAMAQTKGDLPFRTRAIDIWQASPEAVDEMESLREQEALQTAMQAAAAQPAPGTGQQQVKTSDQSNAQRRAELEERRKP
jgi:hypothetical protein